MVQGLKKDNIEEIEEITDEERELRQNSFRVMSHCCSNCLFSPQKLVSDVRKETILDEIVNADDFFICHEASEQGQIICCRGFFERYKDKVNSLRLAQLYGRLYRGSLRFVQPLAANLPEDRE